MKRYIQGEERSQVTLLPECLDDYIAEDNTVRVVDVFVDELDLATLGFEGVAPAITGRPSYHPSVLLKLYILMRRKVNVATEMSLHVLAYNLKRVIRILGVANLINAMRLAGA
jgi:transposase